MYLHVLHVLHMYWGRTVYTYIHVESLVPLMMLHLLNHSNTQVRDTCKYRYVSYVDMLHNSY